MFAGATTDGFFHAEFALLSGRIMGPKRSPDSDLHPPSKLPKLEHHHHHQAPAATSPLQPARAAANTDFSGSVKKKLANSTRTGQACDRCKVRHHYCSRDSRFKRAQTRLPSSFFALQQHVAADPARQAPCTVAQPQLHLCFLKCDSPYHPDAHC